ncbi:MAG TPA: hypothetical protein VF766_04850, partial [Pyrinomonadaceae bacterium]
QGLKLQPQWTVMEGEIEAQLSGLVENYDLIIWGMSALKLFPADYAPVLEVARREGIPVWAVVAGMEFLSDDQTFTNQIVPDYKAQLPELSEIILCGTQEEPPDEVIMRLLASNGQMIAEMGHRRRKTTLADRLQARLSRERRTASVEMDRAVELLETARLGVESLKIMSATVVREVCGDFIRLEGVADQFYQEMVEMVNQPVAAVDAESVQSRLSRTLSELRSEKLESEIGRQFSEGASKIDRWCEEASMEMHRFFRPFGGLTESPLQLQDALHISPEEVKARLQPVFNEFRQNILGLFDNFRARLETDILMKVLGLIPRPVEAQKEEPQREEPLYRWQDMSNQGTVDSSSNKRDDAEYSGTGGRATEPGEKEGIAGKLGQMFDNIIGATGIVQIGVKAEEDRALSILRQEVKQFKTALAESVNSLREKSKAILAEVVQNHADISLNIAGQSLSHPQARLSKLLLAEKILQGER